MAKIILEPGDTCEVEDNAESGWNPESVDELIVTLISWMGPMRYWKVVAESTGREGIIHENYLHFKS